MSPKRIQQRRTRGWRMPENARSVARPSKWGNPFSVEEFGHRVAIDKYRMYVAGRIREGRLDVSELHGKDLACWCPINPGWVDGLRDEPAYRCHADVLLELANPVPEGMTP